MRVCSDGAQQSGTVLLQSGPACPRPRPRARNPYWDGWLKHTKTHTL